MVQDAPQIGETMDDKSVYIGISPTTGQDIYAMPHDAMDSSGARLSANFNRAAQCVKELNEQNYLSHNDWRLPDFEELKILCQEQKTGDLSGTFNMSGPFKGSYYRSSTASPPYGEASLCFTDNRGSSTMYSGTSVRFIRTVGPVKQEPYKVDLESRPPDNRMPPRQPQQPSPQERLEMQARGRANEARRKTIAKLQELENRRDRW